MINKYNSDNENSILENFHYVDNLNFLQKLKLYDVYIVQSFKGGKSFRQVGHDNFTSIQLFKHVTWNLCLQGVIIIFFVKND